MRTLVCGGRDYANYARVCEVLDELVPPPTAIIHGGARGADELAGRWARARGIPVSEFPADWKAHGRSAGPIRNRKMFAEGRPDRVVAFPGGRGTADMIEVARMGGCRVLRIDWAQGPTAREVMARALGDVCATDYFGGVLADAALSALRDAGYEVFRGAERRGEGQSTTGGSDDHSGSVGAARVIRNDVSGQPGRPATSTKEEV